MKKLILLILAFMFLAVASANAETYKVVKGDNMSRIAKNHGINLRAMVKVNPGIKNPNLIYPNQILTIPTVVQTQTSTVEDEYTPLDSLGQFAFGDEGDAIKLIKMFSLQDEVKRLLIEKVKKGDLEWTSIKNGDRFQEMGFRGYKIAKKKFANWSESHLEAARLYKVEFEGEIYLLFDPLRCRNWAWRKEKPAWIIINKIAQEADGSLVTPIPEFKFKLACVNWEGEFSNHADGKANLGGFPNRCEIKEMPVEGWELISVEPNGGIVEVGYGETKTITFVNRKIAPPPPRRRTAPPPPEEEITPPVVEVTPPPAAEPPAKIKPPVVEVTPPPAAEPPKAVIPPIVEDKCSISYESYGWAGHYWALEGGGQSDYYGAKANVFYCPHETSWGRMREGVGAVINGWDGDNSGYEFRGNRWSIGPVVDLITKDGSRFTTTLQLGQQRDAGYDGVGYEASQKTKILYFGQTADFYNVSKSIFKTENWLDVVVDIGHEKESSWQGWPISEANDPAENKSSISVGSRVYFWQTESFHGGLVGKGNYAFGDHSIGLEAGPFVSDKEDIIKVGAGFRHQFNSAYETNNGSQIGIGMDLDIVKTIDKIVRYLKTDKKKEEGK